MALGTGYRPGCGPEPALKSARRWRPAACSTPPRPSSSLVGSWPEGQHWWYDLDDKEETIVTEREEMGVPSAQAVRHLSPRTAAAIWCHMKCCVGLLR